MTRPRKSSYLLLSLVVLVLDQWTKHWIETRFEILETQSVIPGFFNLTHIQNTGVAFGLFAHGGSTVATVLLTVLGLGAMGAVALYFWRTSEEEWPLLLALALILGGAVGNLVDRFFSGAVTDFLDFYVGTYHWHTFNIADSAITIGVVIMLLDLLFARRRPAEPPPA